MPNRRATSALSTMPRDKPPHASAATARASSNASSTAKLVLHWAHGVWAWVPEIPTLLSLAVIVGILATVTVTSLLAARSARSKAGYAALPDSAPAPNGDRVA